jgi:hypothetical protein
MKVMERCSQSVLTSNNDEVLAIEKKFDALEAKMEGAPQKRRYWAGYGGLVAGTMVWEREWDSMASIEAYFEKTFTDAEWVATTAEASKIYGPPHFELYMPW